MERMHSLSEIDFILLSAEPLLGIFRALLATFKTPEREHYSLAVVTSGSQHDQAPDDRKLAQISKPALQHSSAVAQQHSTHDTMHYKQNLWTIPFNYLSSLIFI